MAGCIAQVDPMGREVLYSLDTPLGEIRVLQSGSQAQYGIGATVGLSFCRGMTLCFDAHGDRLPAVEVMFGNVLSPTCKVAG